MNRAFPFIVFLWLVFTSPPNAQVIPRCAACGLPIVVDYIEVEGRVFHRDHFTCDRCGKPIQEAYVSSEGRNYHADCFDRYIAVRCFVCNQSIRDSCQTDYWGDTWHPEHSAHFWNCDFCQRPVAGRFAVGRKKLEDDRWLCGLCAPKSIATQEQADSLMAQVVRDLRSDGLVIKVANVTLALVGRERLQVLSPDSTRHLQGFTDYASPVDSRGRPQWAGANVSLLSGMPRTQMIAVMAHELMHVWQGSRNVYAADAALREGSANYASYLVLQRLGTPESEFIVHQMLEETDPVYGEGFRRVKRYVEKNGIEAWLKLFVARTPMLSDNE